MNIHDQLFKAADFSPETEDWIIQEAKLCRQRVDTEEHYSADELCKSLGLK